MHLSITGIFAQRNNVRKQTSISKCVIQSVYIWKEFSRCKALVDVKLVYNNRDNLRQHYSWIDFVACHILHL